MSKLKLDYQDLFDLMWSIVKIRQHDNVVDLTSVFYTENDVINRISVD